MSGGNGGGARPCKGTVAENGGIDGDVVRCGADDGGGGGARECDDGAVACSEIAGRPPKGAVEGRGIASGGTVGAARMAETVVGMVRVLVLVTSHNFRA